MTDARVAARLKARIADARAYQHVFDTPEGKRVLYDILRAGNVLAVGHVPGDPHASIFNDGRRAVALHVLDQLRWSEAELVKLAQMQTGEDLGEREQD